MFFDNLTITTPAGDYNGNGTVDAADYVVWRKTLGQFVQPFSGADGDGNGTVDDPDYSVWKTHFGIGQPPGGAAAAVPEPVFSAGLIVISLLAWAFGTRFIGRGSRSR
jgi:hypothetical protein